jgi:hypothetical protein
LKCSPLIGGAMATNSPVPIAVAQICQAPALP